MVQSFWETVWKFFRVKHKVTKWPNNSIPRYISKMNETYSHKDSHTNICSRFIHKSQNEEMILMPIKWWTDNQIVVHTQENTTQPWNWTKPWCMLPRGEPQKYYAACPCPPLLRTPSCAWLSVRRAQSVYCWKNKNKKSLLETTTSFSVKKEDYCCVLLFFRTKAMVWEIA